jgi:hypothetical protein
MKHFHIHALTLTASLVFAPAAFSHDSTLPPINIHQLMFELKQFECPPGSDPAMLGYIEHIGDGRAEFKIYTLENTYAGVTDLKNPGYSMAAQVLQVGNQKYFCLHD